MRNYVKPFIHNFLLRETKNPAWGEVLEDPDIGSEFCTGIETSIASYQNLSSATGDNILRKPGEGVAPSGPCIPVQILTYAPGPHSLYFLHIYKVKNRAKIFLPALFFVVFLLFLIVLLPKTAGAGLITAPPKYLGLTNGLVGYWSFDGKDMAGTVAYDRSGQGNNGTLTSGPLRAIGRIGQALEFDGVDDYVDVGNSSTLKPSLPISISLWVNRAVFTFDVARQLFNNDGFTGVCLGNYSGVRMEIDSRIIISFGDNTSCTSSARRGKIGNTGLKADKWYPVGGIIRGTSDMSIYLDGVNDGGTYDGTASSLAYRNIPGQIGAAQGTAPFKGLIDDVRIYNRALTADEIKRLYNMGR